MCKTIVQEGNIWDCLGFPSLGLKFCNFLLCKSWKWKTTLGPQRPNFHLWCGIFKSIKWGSARFWQINPLVSCPSLFSSLNTVVFLPPPTQVFSRRVCSCLLVAFKSLFISKPREGNSTIPGKAQVFLSFHLPFLSFHLPPEWSKPLQMCLTSFSVFRFCAESWFLWTI